MIIYRSLKELNKIAELRRADRVVLVTSSFLRKKLKWAIAEMGQLGLPNLRVVVIPDGEKAKDWEVLKKILVRFTQLKLTKKSLVIALGGGSVSDLVGFACSIYKRAAVSYINIPTTLLAQVDAAIGGKTGIDFEGCKNLLGSFYEPIAIFVIADFLKSLKECQLLDGLAEITKAGLIRDPKILDVLDSHRSLLLKNRAVLEELVLRAIAVKRYFVNKDPNDNGIRQCLNFGHTIGHALELKYKLSHGRAILAGMMLELRVAELLGIKTSAAIIRLKRLGVDFDPRQFVIDRQLILQDKKITGFEIILPVVRTVGRVELVKIGLDKLMVVIRKCNQKQL